MSKSNDKLSVSPLQYNETKRSKFDEEYNSASMMASRNLKSNVSQSVSHNKNQNKRMYDSNDYDTHIKKDFSIDHLHEAKDLEGLIQARRDKLEDVENEIKIAEGRLNEIKNENMEN